MWITRGVPTQVKEELPEHELLVFTGPIDAYFASQVSVRHTIFIK